MALLLLGHWGVTALFFSLTLLAATPGPVDVGELSARAEGPSTLTLDEALLELDRRNFDLKSAQIAIEDAEAVAASALAAVKPMVSGSGTYTLNNDEALLNLDDAFAGVAQALEQATGMPVDLGSTGGATTIQPRQSVTGGVQAAVPLFAAHAYADISAARASVDVSTHNARALQTQLRGALRQAAWLAGAAEAFVGVAERAAGNAASHAERTLRLLDAGRTTRLSYDQAQLLLLQRRNDLLSARAELEKAQLSIGVMLGREGPVRIALPAAFETAPTPALDDALDQAFGQREELRSRRADEKAAKSRLRSARMKYTPTLSATFGAHGNTAEYVTGLNYAWQLGLALNWTLYAGGSRRAGAKRAQAGLQLARNRSEQERLQVRQEVLDAHRELQLTRAKYRLSVEEAKVAQRAAESAERMFAQGQAGSLDVLDALDAWFQADLRREEARARAAATRAQLDAARGQP